jgi:hypothetical protein
MGKLVMTVVIFVQADDSFMPEPGQWKGSGNFEGTFTVSEDSTKITNLSGSFNTYTCGNIQVPGDLDPPAEIKISGNKISAIMSEAGTSTYLNIEGSFNSPAILVGGFRWAVDGCGSGGPILFAAEWEDIKQTQDPLFETVLYMPDDTGYAFVFDNDSLDLGVGENDDFTIEAFFYVPDLNYENIPVDVITRKKDSYTFYINFDKDSPDWIFFELIAAGGGEIILGVELDILEGWHHVAAVFDNEFTESHDMMAIFLDGERVANSEDEQFQPDWTPGIPNSFRDLEVGGVVGGSAGFYGYLEEIRLSSVVRYNGATYTVPTEPFIADADTRALWHFDETPGSTVFVDASSYGNNLIGGDGAQVYQP